MEKLFDIQQIILEQFEEQSYYSRKVFESITLDNFITGIVGPRGVGKTTFLLHYAMKNGAKKRQALYISVDNLYFLEHRLLDLVDRLYKETDIRLLCIDEIHKYPNWNQELKNIVDTYPKFKIIFSGSSTLDLVRGKYDLSRRVTLLPIHGFSFREYLEFYLKIQLPLFKLEDLLNNHSDCAQQIPVQNILKHFHDYLQVGYYPFFARFTQEREKFQAIENATQKTIYEDIGIFHSLKTPTLSLLEQLFKYVLQSAPGELNAYKLARYTGKDFESISEYLKFLQEAGLLRFLYPKSVGKTSLRNPSKMYPENTNLIYASYLPLKNENALGKVRETFVINQMQNALLPIFYSQQGDFLVDDLVFEVGGKNKSSQQIKGIEKGYILADGILVGYGNRIPLYLLGFLS